MTPRATLATVIRLLLIEDDPAWATIVNVNLVRGDSPEFSLEAASRLGEALRFLDAKAFDLVLTDLTLPDSAGLGTFHAIHSRAPNVPVVILSGVGDEEIALEAVREGAQDPQWRPGHEVDPCDRYRGLLLAARFGGDRGGGSGGSSLETDRPDEVASGAGSVPRTQPLIGSTCLGWRSVGSLRPTLIG